MRFDVGALIDRVKEHTVLHPSLGNLRHRIAADELWADWYANNKH